MKILISAAETSSDAHGALLLRALRELAQARGADPVDAFGVGGPKLEAEGLRRVVDARELLAMGFHEIIGRLPKIVGALNRIARAARNERPDIAVVIDYPDFHFRLAKRLKAQGVPVVYYIPPKVWAWRKGRVEVLKSRFAKVLNILPFEVEFYRQVGMPAVYVGNPLADSLPKNLTRSEARRGLSLLETDRVLVVMPGSRPSEFKEHTELFLESARVAAAKLRDSGFLKRLESNEPKESNEKLVVLVPLPQTADADAFQGRVSRWLDQNPGSTGLDLRVSQGNAHECLVAADAGIIKSGTSTLEAGLLGCPHAVVYRPSRMSAWIYRNLIRYKGPVGLVNLVAHGLGERESYLMREILCEAAEVPAIAEEAASLFQDKGKLENIRTGIRDLRAKVYGEDPTASPSRRAAEEIYRVWESSGGTRK